jgi:hypothetical protein
MKDARCTGARSQLPGSMPSAGLWQSTNVTPNAIVPYVVAFDHRPFGIPDKIKV